MIQHRRIAMGLGVLAVALWSPRICSAEDDPNAIQQQREAKTQAKHPAVGSWFGRAVQVCAEGDATCAKVALFMTPTLTADGIFLGNDTLALGTAPLGPHTTAHGGWIPTGRADFIADYTFMLPPTPPTKDPTISAPRFRWAAKVIDATTAVGYVNIFFAPPIPIQWEALKADQFPPLPAEATPVLTPPFTVISDPGQCKGAACPLVFKFTIKRVEP